LRHARLPGAIVPLFRGEDRQTNRIRHCLIARIAGVEVVARLHIDAIVLRICGIPDSGVEIGDGIEGSRATDKSLTASRIVSPGSE